MTAGTARLSSRRPETVSERRRQAHCESQQCRAAPRHRLRVAQPACPLRQSARHHQGNDRWQAEQVRLDLPQAHLQPQRPQRGKPVRKAGFDIALDHLDQRRHVPGAGAEGQDRKQQPAHGEHPPACSGPRERRHIAAGMPQQHETRDRIRQRDVAEVKQQCVEQAEHRQEQQSPAVEPARILERHLQPVEEQRETGPEQHAEERHELAEHEAGRQEVRDAVCRAGIRQLLADGVGRAGDERLDVDEQDAEQREPAQRIDARITTRIRDHAGPSFKSSCRPSAGSSPSAISRPRGRRTC
jgi:hypothetical protein